MVEQVDRDAAAEMWTVLGNVQFVHWQSDWMRDGTADRGPVVQAFCDHRIAAEARGMERAAKIVSSYDADWFGNSPLTIATAIRAALNGGQHE